MGKDKELAAAVRSIFVGTAWPEKKRWETGFTESPVCHRSIGLACGRLRRPRGDNIPPGAEAGPGVCSSAPIPMPQSVDAPSRKHRRINLRHTVETHGEFLLEDTPRRPLADTLHDYFDAKRRKVNALVEAAQQAAAEAQEAVIPILDAPVGSQRMAPCSSSSARSTTQSNILPRSRPLSEEVELAYKRIRGPDPVCRPRGSTRSSSTGPAGSIMDLLHAGPVALCTPTWRTYADMGTRRPTRGNTASLPPSKRICPDTRHRSSSQLHARPPDHR